MPLYLRNDFLGLYPYEMVLEMEYMLSLELYRLQLVHNQLSHIAYEFTGCSALRYLNLRDNRFRQVPKAVS